MSIACWCGNAELHEWNTEYVRCPLCETLLSTRLQDDLSTLYQPEDKAGSLYGSGYWFEKTFSAYKAMGCEDLDDAIVLHYRERAGLWLNAVTRHLLPPARVLEIGCGLGTLVRWMLDLGYAISALELSAEWCAYLTGKLKILVEARELTPCGLDDSKLDSIIMMDVLEHVATPAEFLATVRGRLKDNGILFIQLPKYPEGASFQELQAANHRFLRQLLPQEHLFLYSENALKKLMTRAGFAHSLQYPALGAVDDMFFVFSGKPLPTHSDVEIKTNFMSRPECVTAYAAYMNYRHLEQAREEAASAKSQCQAALSLLEKMTSPPGQSTTISPFGEYMKQSPQVALPDGFSATKVNRLLYLRLDGIGDAILANSLLEKLPGVFPNAKISVVCDRACADIYEACPLVDDVMPLNKSELKKPEYFHQAARLVNARKADLALHALASPTPYAAALALASRLPVIGLEADTCNMSPDDREAYNEKLALQVPTNSNSPAELRKYEDMLAALNAPASMLQPTLWLTERHRAEAREVWDRHGLIPERTIAVFSKGASAPGYSMFGHALLATCRKNGWFVAALGVEADFQLNEESLRMLRAHDVPYVNFSGAMSLLTCAAFLAQCRLALGVDTSLAHIACALDVPQVIALGGGFPGRFLPQHRTTTAVCLPLECWGCGWRRCQYEQPYCVNGIAPETLAEAIECALSPASPQTGYGHILMQAPLTWKKEQGKPRWRSPARLIQQQKHEKHPIAFSIASVAAAEIHRKRK